MYSTIIATTVNITTSLLDIDIDIYFSDPQIMNIINIYRSLCMIVIVVEMRGAA